MQTVNATFTAESRDRVRSVAASLLVSWKKSFNSNISFFQIGVSTIGGTDIIGSVNAGNVVTEWDKYQYFDESAQIINLDYERALQMPGGGLNRALADGILDNTSGRYLPQYMGGNSEFATAVLPRRPIKIHAGFNYSGIDNLLPQFVGLFTKQPEISVRNREMMWQAADFVDFLANRFVDNTIMFTSQRTDQVLETILSGQGLQTADYVLDPGINIIPFGIFEKGTKWGNIIHELVEAEYGQFYQDESGILRFENRQHWDASPHNTIQEIIYTADVLEARAPDTDHIINVVEVRGQPRAKQPYQVVFNLGSPIEIGASADKEFFVDFDDPMLAIDTPTFIANDQENGEGTDRTNSVYLKASDEFAKAAKYIYHNNHTSPVFITSLSILGRPARVTEDIYYRAKDDSSVTAYEERVYQIDNDYIQDESWANSFAQMILNDFSEPENIQELTIKAKPQLQLGDLVSWQGRYWRVFGIKTLIDSSRGFLQDITLLQRTITTYFRIGISTIGGTDRIAP